jgi:hypothetical protein
LAHQHGLEKEKLLPEHHWQLKIRWLWMRTNFERMIGFSLPPHKGER